VGRLTGLAGERKAKRNELSATKRVSNAHCGFVSIEWIHPGPHVYPPRSAQLITDFFKSL
jgi:hypothetical protein